MNFLRIRNYNGNLAADYSITLSNRLYLNFLNSDNKTYVSLRNFTTRSVIFHL